MRIRRIAAWAWLALIVAACLLPARWLPVHETGGGASRQPHVDKIVHFGLFLVFGLLWGRQRLGVGLAIALAAALVTEVAQGHAIIARDPNVLDGVADIAGTLVGLAMTALGGPEERPIEPTDSQG